MSNVVFHFCCSSLSIVLQLANKLSVPKFAYKFNLLCDICQLFASLRHPVSGAVSVALWLLKVFVDASVMSPG